MADTFTAQFLGTGTSVGVPLIGCTCPVCKSSDPRDNRLRSSLYVTLGERALLIDAGPDLRAQCLRWQVPRVDAVFITHLHADHIFGFDDVRRFNTLQDNQVIHCYSGPETIDGMRRIFPYISNKPNGQGLYRPLIEFCPVIAPFEAFGARIIPLPVVHGKAETNGIRIDFNGASLAYVPDVHEIPESTLALMAGVDVLILNMLRERVHPTHLTLSQSLAYAERIAAPKTFFTHLSHDLLHADLVAQLPPQITPAYDGQCITLI
ncbi:MAG: MBL fold metallo-hydrolase [Kiritimatiellae bacterium]|nr:MBL fold metallo-hydrolase [Kiritimatiellia bacterium]